MVAAPDGAFKGAGRGTPRARRARGPPPVSSRAVARLNVTLAVKRLVRDVAARLPELSHVRAARVLVVAGEARRASRATIRPAHFSETRARTGAARAEKPLIRVKGRKILYVVTLRPLWFLESTPRERIATIVHELYHASTRFDGTLHRGRRHSRLPLASYNRRDPRARSTATSPSRPTRSSRRSRRTGSCARGCGSSGPAARTAATSTAGAASTPSGSSSTARCGWSRAGAGRAP